MIRFIPKSRIGDLTETLILPLPWGDMRDDAENPLTAATFPKIPPYDTQATGSFDCNTQTGTGTTADIWWLLVVLPRTYLAVTDLTVKFDDKYTLGGDAVLVAATLDVEAFPYDSTNGDFSNTDICATAAQSIATSFATDSFTLTGTTLTPLTTILIRFTSSIQITSGGGAGTGVNTFNFPRIEFSGKE